MAPAISLQHVAELVMQIAMLEHADEIGEVGGLAQAFGVFSGEHGSLPG
jgi:hypothetical protein